MKPFHFLFPALALVVMLTGCKRDDPEEKPDEGSQPSVTSYTNPVSTISLPDPTVIRADDGLFYLVSTEDAVRGMPVMRSKNLIDWTQAGKVFSDATRPSPNGSKAEGLWAPDINKIGDKYVLYYSTYSSTSEWNWGISAATADKPSGPWIHRSKLFLGGEIGVNCSIDPCFYSENGKNWLLWGSYFGIWAIELSSDGLSLAPGAEKVRLCGLDGYGIEAAMLHKHEGKYYLFVSGGGTQYNEHYQLGVVRSDNLLGPYLNKAGNNVAEGAPVDFFLSAGNGFISPGHCSEILTDDAGVDWLLYHAFVQGQPDGGRRLMLDHLTWSGGWPSIGNGKPTATSSIVPQFK